MLLSLTVTTNHGQSVTVQAENISALTEGIKGAANTLIDLHKELSKSDEMVQSKKIYPSQTEVVNHIVDNIKINPDILNDFAQGPTKTQMQIVQEHEELNAQQPVENQHRSMNDFKAEVTTSSETDIDGIPWDARIHSSGKSRTATGQWTKRKRLVDGVYESVMAELRSKQAPVQNVVIPEINLSPAPPVQSTPPLQSEPAPIRPIGYGDNAEGFRAITPQPLLNVGNVQSSTPLVPDVEQQAKISSVPPVSAPLSNPLNVNGISNVPMYDFKTFQMTLPNVLSELFNKGLLNPQIMSELASELQVQQLWTVMQDQVKCNQLYSSLAHRGLIAKVV